MGCIIFCCLFSYHSLLELHYGKKHEKALITKEWVNAEDLSVRETEHHMDMDMFLGRYDGWKVGSPHHHVILHKMFQYTREQGWKKAEQMICCGHQPSLPKLDLKADVAAIWLVGPQTNKEEFRALYYEVYKFRRLPGPIPLKLEQMEEMATKIMSSLKDHLGWKGGEPLWRMEEPGQADIWPPRSKTPRRGRRDTFAERDLTEV